MKASVLIYEDEGGGIHAAAFSSRGAAISAAKNARKAGEYDGEAIRAGVVLTIASTLQDYEFKCTPASKARGKRK